MILFLSVIVLALVAGLAAGGSLRRVGDVRLRWWLLAPVGFALREVPLSGGRGRDVVIRMVVFGVSYVLVLVFAIRNWRVSAMPLVILGLLLNGLVVTANGGMPVSRSALVASGEDQMSHVLRQHATGRHYLLRPGEDVLTPLADLIPVPPIEDVISVGDVFLYAGLTWVIIAVMRGQTRALDRAEHRGRGRHRRRARAKLAVGPLPGAAPASWASGPWSFPAG